MIRLGYLYLLYLYYFFSAIWNVLTSTKRKLNETIIRAHDSKHGRR